MTTRRWKHGKAIWTGISLVLHQTIKIKTWAKSQGLNHEYIYGSGVGGCWDFIWKASFLLHGQNEQENVFRRRLERLFSRYWHKSDKKPIIVLQKVSESYLLILVPNFSNLWLALPRNQTLDRGGNSCRSSISLIFDAFLHSWFVRWFLFYFHWQTLEYI